MIKICNTKVVFIMIFIMMLISNVSAVENVASGFTVKSISSSKIISNDKDINSANITLNVVANGGGQSVVGYFNKNDFKSWLTDIIVQYPLKIEIGHISETLTYPIVTQGTLYKYSAYTKDAPDILNGAKCDPSPSYCFPLDTDRRGIGLDRVLIVKRYPIGSYGAFQNPDIKWSGIATISVNGIPYKQEINSVEYGSIQFRTVTGEWIANMKWVGSLVTGQAVPNQNLYVATYVSGNKVWKIAPKTDYDVYTKSIELTDSTFGVWKTQMGSDFDSSFYVFSRDYVTYRDIAKSLCKDLSCSGVLKYVNIHNANVDVLIGRNERISYGSVTSVSSTISNSKEKGNVIDIIDRKISNPELIITLKASELNILIPSGIPEIISVESKSFDSGDNTGTVYITVKNIGDSTGTFSSYFVDNSGILISQSTSESSKTTIKPGDTGIISVKVSHDVNSEGVTKSGSLTVYDVNNGKKVTREFSITMNSPKLFIPDKESYYNDVIYKSSDDGKSENVVLRCESGLLEYVDGKYVCKEIINDDSPISIGNVGSYESGSSDGSKTNKSKDSESDDGNSGIFYGLMYWMLLFVGLTVLTVIFNKFRNGDEKITKENVDKSMMIAGIIVGVFYIYIQFVSLMETLGIMLWIILLFSILFVCAVNVYLMISRSYILSKIVSIMMFVIIFIILTQIAVSFKEISCGSFLTRWMFDNCDEFSVMKYLFG